MIKVFIERSFIGIKKEYFDMAEILVVLFGILLGGLPTLYVIWEAIATISKKVVRKVKYGISMFD